MRKGVRICRERGGKIVVPKQESADYVMHSTSSTSSFSSPTTQHSRMPTSREEPRQLSTTYCVVVQVYQDIQIYSVDPSSHLGRLSTNSMSGLKCRLSWRPGHRSQVRTSCSKRIQAHSQESGKCLSGQPSYRRLACFHGFWEIASTISGLAWSFFSLDVLFWSAPRTALRVATSIFKLSENIVRNSEIPALFCLFLIMQLSREK